ncbi:YggT family protein [Candidatus Pantoea edessiphila]|uniref:YggT family protein n=1 Tax=Candidatus Pantoea edessiphila TaxID=2044610 RepID=A0A2P5SV78_9GAMM|nr:YggT family protein [Candidatus Pantoea edessiphila]PPI86252.1 hypothetical protein CRV10_03700 [Candidatus Pantoea edessiphila]
MLTLFFLTNTAFDFFITVLLIRILMQVSKCDSYNPISQSIIKITQPILKPLYKILPFVKTIDIAALSLVYFLSTMKLPVLRSIITGIFYMTPTSLLVGVLALFKSTGSIIFWVIIIRSLLSWINQGYNPLDFTLHQMSEIIIGPIRKLLPNTGIIDFSPMIVIFILYTLNYLCLDLFSKFWYYL